jgi:hypothetical protein
VATALLAVAASACSGSTSGGGSANGSGGSASNSGGSGGASSGGLSSVGGAHSGGSISAGGAHAGGSVSTGGTNGAGGASSAGGAAGSSGLDAGQGNLCGSVPCFSTRCAGVGCGAALCCPSSSGPVCVHGLTQCPAADGGLLQETLECWTHTASDKFAKTCAKPSDCVVAQHWAGCCNIRAVGLNASEQSAFTAFEASCGGAPACGCYCDRVTAEDGTTVASGGAISVDCVGGLCTAKTP